MAFSFVGAATGTNTCTVPAHDVGDIIIICAAGGRGTSSAQVPAGFTSIALSSPSSVLAYRIATSTGDAAGTWTNAVALCCQVYRPSAGAQAAIGASGVSSGAASPASYAGLTLLGSSGSSWVAAFAVANGATTIATTPAGLTARADAVASFEVVGFDTAGPVSSWSTVAQAFTGSANWATFTVEIQDIAIHASAAVTLDGAAASVTAGTASAASSSVKLADATASAAGTTPSSNGSQVALSSFIATASAGNQASAAVAAALASASAAANAASIPVANAAATTAPATMAANASVSEVVHAAATLSGCTAIAGAAAGAQAASATTLGNASAAVSAVGVNRAIGRNVLGDALTAADVESSVAVSADAELGDAVAIAQARHVIANRRETAALLI